MKRIKYAILLSLVILLPFVVYAGRGCCSHHGGVSHCDTDTGRQVCNDGTYSPSCRCGTGTSDLDDDEIEYEYEYEYEDKKYVDEYEEEIEEEEDYSIWIIFLLFFVVPTIFGCIGSKGKNHTSKWWE